MSALVVVLAPDAGRGVKWSCWVADRVAERLHAAGCALRRQPPPRLVRGSWTPPSPADADTVGVAFFGHGWKGCVVGNDLDPLIGRENLPDLEGCWVYAFSCNSARELLRGAAPPLTHAVGYDLRIVADVEPEQIPAVILPDLCEFLALVPLALAKGGWTRADLQRRLLDAGDSLNARLADTPVPGLATLVDQLIFGLRIDPTD